MSDSNDDSVKLEHDDSAQENGGDESTGALGDDESAEGDNETGDETYSQTNNADSEAADDPELEAIKARVREMEEEAEKLKQMQDEVEKQMNMSPPSKIIQLL